MSKLIKQFFEETDSKFKAIVSCDFMEGYNLHLQLKFKLVYKILII